MNIYIYIYMCVCVCVYVLTVKTITPKCYFWQTCILFISELVLILLLFIKSMIAYKFDRQHAGYQEVPSLPPATIVVVLAYNCITSLHYNSFADHTEIIFLDLDNNYLSTIDSDAFRDLVKLRILNLRNNTLIAVPPLTDIADTLVKLFLTYNTIGSLVDIPICPQLEGIYLTPHFKNTPPGIFDGFKALKKIGMLYWSLVETSDLFSNGSFTVTKLKFRCNHITKLPDLSLYSNLQEADFRFNSIPTINVEEFVAVSSSLIVRLDGNPLWCDPESCLAALSSGQGWSITGTCEEEDFCACKYGMLCSHLLILVKVLLMFRYGCIIVCRRFVPMYSPLRCSCCFGTLQMKGHKWTKIIRALVTRIFTTHHLHFLNKRYAKLYTIHWIRLQGAVSIRKTVLPGMAIPMLKIRRPNGRLIFNMEFAIRR